jgi:methionine synthase II (cobalamin-independent)
MDVQFNEAFPGIRISEERMWVDRQGLDTDLEKLYFDYSVLDSSSYGISQEFACGLHSFMEKDGNFPCVKGQITGPISLGLSLNDEKGCPIMGDDILRDALVKHLSLKAMWQERELLRLFPQALIFVDEPSLSFLGSAFTTISPDVAISLLKEVLASIHCLKGVHCCSNADWPILLQMPIDVLSFDTYAYHDSLSLYPGEVKRFLEEGGTISWGIVPNDEESLARESLGSIKDRLEEAMAPLTRKGISFRQLLEQGMVTPSCGLAFLSPEGACEALELLAQLSKNLRQKYSL